MILRRAASGVRAAGQRGYVPGSVADQIARQITVERGELSCQGPCKPHAARSEPRRGTLADHGHRQYPIAGQISDRHAVYTCAGGSCREPGPYAAAFVKDSIPMQEGD
jgi:hypothetical protein